ncbi:sigma-54-dependent Fis family transcriptional regulator [Pseudoduganella umbonata]|uniref:Sigma-54-dependent Fis family transcriptional regulator n=1 Tax=Pseudoduganella umbonata TaxID=864828 RepID=A0A4P8HQW4_9BURK|nr:sigma-54-dependent Fis family transcriptional regulator [Pseudoduganella umbonata]MBB3222639.1 transcriptional regulator of acetoin/glycerol metabolism [Pseudoduganella umbonata]QCP10854.1 sigma-54-dependent Fis family transcriptional regulator [Pseudoduganella umbonata]
MKKDAYSRHVDHVMSAALHGAPAEVGDELILKSWRRCIADYGLDPSRLRAPHIVTSHTLRAHQEQIEQFMGVARVGMEQMYKRVSGLGYVLLLTDAAGVTVDYIGNDAHAAELKKAGLYLGAEWSEQSAGTCAVGTCVAEQAALTCHQADHFDPTHIPLTCSAAPLFDPEGKFLAVLDLSALTSPADKKSQHLALHLTMMYAQMIEDANFLRHFEDRAILRLGTTWALVEVSGEIMLAYDEQGTVVGANTGARRLFRDAAAGVGGRTLAELFELAPADLHRLLRFQDASDRSIVTRGGGRMFYTSVRPPRQRPAARRIAVDAAGDSQASLPELERLAGDDKAMRRLLDQAKRLVNRKLNILVHGETGTGKEVVARALHQSSNRAARPFVAVNCGAIPESLIESELFGYTAGTFTGGRAKGMKGLILQSDGGTLFLDEIGDMPLHLQTRLLRVLSEKEVLPLGADRPVPLDLTVIAASHRDLRNLIGAGTFREDLYYRLCGATLHLPPLRLRDDKRYLIAKVLSEEAELLGRDAQLSADAMHALLSFGWPGNIRQLRNVLRYALAISDGALVMHADLPQELTDQFSATHGTSAVPALPWRETGVEESGDADAGALHAALVRSKWNVTRAAADLNLARATVYRYMRKFGIVPPNQR